MKHLVKRDANQRELIIAIKRLGWLVMDISEIGYGVPDLLVQKRGQKEPTVKFIEIKNPKTSYGRKGLNRRQRAFAAEWGSDIYVVSTLDDVCRFCRGELPAVGIDMHEVTLKSVGVVK